MITRDIIYGVCILLISFTSCKRNDSNSVPGNSYDGRVQVAPFGSYTALPLEEDSIRLDLVLEEPYELRTIDLLFGNYQSNELNLNYILEFKILEGDQELFVEEYSMKIRDNAWMKFEVGKLVLESAKYTLQIKQISDHKLVWWGKNQKLFAILNDRIIDAFEISSQGAITPFEMSNGQLVDLGFVAENDLLVSSIELSFGNYAADDLNLDYHLRLNILHSENQVFGQDYFTSIKDNAWTTFSVPNLVIKRGYTYRVQIKQITDYKLVQWGKDGKLWIKLNS